MGQKDLSEKILVDYNDVFADILNVCVYEGEEVVKPEELENTSVHAQYKAEDDKLHEEERDVAKYWKKENIAIAMYGIENQVKVDQNMPFRMIGYDGASYRGQLLDKRKSVVPVASFVLYFGIDRRWNKYKSIKECITIPDDPREIQHVDEVLKLLSVMTGDGDYESILYIEQKEGKVKNM